MKRIIIYFLIVLTAAFCISGCSSDEDMAENSEFAEIRKYIESGNYDDAKKALDSIEESKKNDEYHLLYADYYQDKSMGEDSRAYSKRDYNSAADYLCKMYSNVNLFDLNDDVKAKFEELLEQENVSDGNKDKIKAILGKTASGTGNYNSPADGKAADNAADSQSGADSGNAADFSNGVFGKGIEPLPDNSYESSQGTLVNYEFPGIYSNTATDYSTCRDTSNYEDYSDGYIKMKYPTGIYNSVEKDNSSSGCVITFNGSDSQSILMYGYLFNNGVYSDIKAATRELYENFENGFYNTSQVIYSDESSDHGRFIFTAYTDASQSVAVYCLCTVEQDVTKYFIISYPEVTDETSPDWYNKNYYVDYIYRTCDFSGTTYLPRTFEEFSKGNMGTKK